jgi:acylphosphatase
VTVPVIRHVVFSGEVQGVGFRAFVEYEAVRRNVEGWVRNRRGRIVEAVFAGPHEAVEAVIAVSRVGPRGARVDGIEVRVAGDDELALRGPVSFAVLPTV